MSFFKISADILFDDGLDSVFLERENSHVSGVFTRS